LRIAINLITYLIEQRKSDQAAVTQTPEIHLPIRLMNQPAIEDAQWLVGLLVNYIFR
jgi:hypothetical protein